MKKKLDIAKWEFLEKVRSKAFLVSLVLMPAIMVGFGVLPTLFASKGDDSSVVIGIIDETGMLLNSLSEKLDQKYRLPNDSPNYVLRNLGTDGTPENRRRNANQMVSTGEIEGYFYMSSEVLEKGVVEYRSENVANIRVVERFSRSIEEVILEKRLIEKGLGVNFLKDLRTKIDVKSLKISGEEERESGFLQTFFGAYLFIMMLMFMVLTSGQLLIRSVVEEKSNRVIEVLLSSCSPSDLMVGKILGLSGLGLLQLFIWLIIAAAISVKVGANILDVDHLFLMMVYFILGYLLYAAIFVGAGSPVTTEQEAQQITTYVSLTLVFPIILAIPAMLNPDATLIKILTFIPLLTPAFMLLRLTIQTPPAWEIVTTLSILLVSVVGAMWLAGKIFRVAILAYGKRPTIPELFKLIRTR